MALPDLTPEQRKAALEKATQARSQRASLKRELKCGNITLADVLSRSDEDTIVSKLKVKALIGALPGVGSARTSQVMESIGIAASRRVGGLGPHQRQALLDQFD